MPLQDQQPPVNIQVFTGTSSDTVGTWTMPTGPYQVVRVTLNGAGGGGGGGAYGTQTPVICTGGGGGGSAERIEIFFPASTWLPGTIETATAGKYGAGGGASG